MKPYPGTLVTGFFACLVFALVGCARPVEVELDYVRPAEHDLPPTVRRLAVEQFAAAPEDERWAQLAKATLIDSLSAPEPRHRRFDVTASKQDADAVVSGRVSVVTEQQRGLREPTGAPADGAVEYVRRRSRATVGFTVADTRTAGTLAAVTVTRESQWDGEGPGPADETIDGLIKECVEAFVERINPRPVAVTEYLAPGTSEPARRADRRAADGDHEAALELYLRAAELRPEDHNSVFAAGLMCEAMGRLEQARQYYARAVEIEPRRQYLRALDRLSQ